MHEDCIGASVDADDSERLAGDAQAMAFEQCLDGIGDCTEAIDYFFLHCRQFVLGAAVGEPLVDHESLMHVGTVGFG